MSGHKSLRCFTAPHRLCFGRRAEEARATTSRLLTTHGVSVVAVRSSHRVACHAVLCRVATDAVARQVGNGTGSRDAQQWLSSLLTGSLAHVRVRQHGTALLGLPSALMLTCGVRSMVLWTKPVPASTPCPSWRGRSLVTYHLASCLRLPSPGECR